MGEDDFKILCITDVHLGNSGTFASAWLGTNIIIDEYGKSKIKKLIKKTNPDLIIVGGDTCLTAWNDICTMEFANFMDKFQIPWAPIFGNHDYEGRADKAKLAEIYENAEYCLFECGPEGLNGMGNYVINLTRGNEIVYSLFLLDDGQDRITDGGITYGGVGEKQIEWFEWADSGIKGAAGKVVPSMVFMHIPVPEYQEQQDNFIAGQRGEDTYCAVVNDGFFDVFKDAGGTHIFSGHDHDNNFISVYEGVQLDYMTKSSYNCYYSSKALGGTVIDFDKDNIPSVSIVNF